MKRLTNNRILKEGLIRFDVHIGLTMNQVLHRISYSHKNFQNAQEILAVLIM